MKTPSPPRSGRTLFVEPAHQKAFDDDGLFTVELLDAAGIDGFNAAYAALVPDDDAGLVVDYMRRDRSLVRALSDAVRDVVATPLAELFANPRIVLATCVAKHPGPDSVMFMHDDRTYVDEAWDRSATVWIPLQRTSPELGNGHLDVVPNSHRIVRGQSGTGTPDWIRPYESVLRAKCVPLSTAAGEGVVYDSRLLHASPPNLSAGTRLAIVCAVVDAESTLVHVAATGTRRRVVLCVDEDFFIDNHAHDMLDQLPPELPVLRTYDEGDHIAPTAVADGLGIDVAPATVVIPEFVTHTEPLEPSLHLASDRLVAASGGTDSDAPSLVIPAGRWVSQHTLAALPARLVVRDAAQFAVGVTTAHSGRYLSVGESFEIPEPPNTEVEGSNSRGFVLWNSGPGDAIMGVSPIQGGRPVNRPERSQFAEHLDGRLAGSPDDGSPVEVFVARFENQWWVEGSIDPEALVSGPIHPGLALTETAEMRPVSLSDVVDLITGRSATEVGERGDTAPVGVDEEPTSAGGLTAAGPEPAGAESAGPSVVEIGVVARYSWSASVGSECLVMRCGGRGPTKVSIRALATLDALTEGSGTASGLANVLGRSFEDVCADLTQLEAAGAVTLERVERVGDHEVADQRTNTDSPDSDVRSEHPEPTVDVGAISVGRRLSNWFGRVLGRREDLSGPTAEIGPAETADSLIANTGSRPETQTAETAAAASEAAETLKNATKTTTNDGVETAQPADVLAHEEHPIDGRIPVYTVWYDECGPWLAQGMLLASAKAFDGGSLSQHFDFRPIERPESMLADLTRRAANGPVPAIMLSSDYMWSLDLNLRQAREAKQVNPGLFVVHGGPSCPKYEDDARTFLRDNGDVADLLVRGEGEIVFSHLLARLAESFELSESRLDGIGGLTFVDEVTGEVVRTPDQERVADLDTLPSAYLTGEFDHLPSEAWLTTISIETVRGCPYGCTFCDWGSATLARLRKFSLDRVRAEVDWAARKQINNFNVCDANFGIFSRDVETAEIIGEANRKYGYPELVLVYPAKNTTRHLIAIMDVFQKYGVAVSAPLSLQTTDEATLEAIKRSNISTDKYVELAADFRRRGHALFGDLMFGLPGQTVKSYKSDLQFLLDLEIQQRVWATQMLPNAPMQEKSYRQKWQIRGNEQHSVIATSTMSADERAQMMRLRKGVQIFERLGIARHLARFLQWDHDISAVDFIEAITEAATDDSGSYPRLSWMMNHYDRVRQPPDGWDSLYDEMEHFVSDRFGIGPSSALGAVMAVQRFVMPYHGRAFPESLALQHDYMAYYLDATASLLIDGVPGRPRGPLAEYGPGSIEIWGDPLDVCNGGRNINGDRLDVDLRSDTNMGTVFCNEMESKMMQNLAPVANHGVVTWRFQQFQDREEPSVTDDVDQSESAQQSTV